MRKQILFMVLAIIFLICAPVATYFIVQSVQPSTAQPPSITNPEPGGNKTPGTTPEQSNPDDKKTPSESETNPPSDPSEGDTDPDVNNPSEGGDHNPEENPDTGDTNPDDTDPEEGDKDPDEGGEGEGGNEPSEDDPEPTPPNPKNEEANQHLAELYGIDYFPFENIDVVEIVLSESGDEIESITFSCANSDVMKQNVSAALTGHDFSSEIAPDENQTMFSKTFEDHILTITITQNEDVFVLELSSAPVELSPEAELAKTLSELFETTISFDGFELSSIDVSENSINFEFVNTTQSEVADFFNSFLNEGEYMDLGEMAMISATRGDKEISIIIMYGEMIMCSISY